MSALVGEIAPEIPLLAIPAIPGLPAASLVRNSSRNSKFAIPGTLGTADWVLGAIPRIPRAIPAVYLFELDAK
jgi:hypothetical protein